MKVLVTGASGQVGRNVVTQLLKAGVEVRAMSRSPRDFPAGVEGIRGDLTEPSTVAFDGVDSVYLFPVEPTAPELVERARAAGVRRIVVLSSLAVDDGFHGAERATEQAVADSGLEWTVVRPGEFMANTLQWAGDIRSSGVVRAPWGDQPSLMIHEADIAAVAVTALLEDGHAGAKYALTGPEWITPREQANAIGAAIGREIRFDELTREQARANWLSRGWPAEVVDWLLNDSAEAAHVVPVLRHTVREVTGRPARTYAQWARDHVADFR
jgi:uncharacterized protein YbjT (DUF2867 family)